MISVGNLTVGGTGKTPIVILVTEWLLAEHKRVAVLSRGYGRTSRQTMLTVSDGRALLANPREAGDEPFLIAQRCPQAVVAVGADRFRLGRRMLDQYSVDCVVLDDGFQRLDVHRDVDVLLVDAMDAFGLDALLPAGRLREPIEATRRATAVIVTRAEQHDQVERVLARLRTAVDPLPPIAQVIFRANELLPVVSGTGRSLEWARGKTALLVSGIGHAASFRRTAEQLGLKLVHEVVYRDHHRYTEQDVAALRGAAARFNAELVVTTEKDAGKLKPLLQAGDVGWWAVRIHAEWIAGESVVRELIMKKLFRAGEGVCA